MTNPLKGTITLPGIGKMKRSYAAAGLGVLVVILGVAYWRHANAPAEATAEESAAADAVDPYTAAGSDTYAPYGKTSGGDVIAAPIDWGTGDGAGGTTSTNSQWSAEAIAVLVQTGMTEAAAAAAISGVLGGLGVTSDQESAFLRAVGTIGVPPQGYPKPIRLISTPQDPAPAPQQPSPGTDTPAQPTTPTPSTPTAGKPAPAKPSGLKVTGKGTTYIDIAWNTQSGVKGYTVYRGSDRVTTVVYGKARVSGLKIGTNYTLGVVAVGTDGQTSAKATITTATTPPKR